MLQVSKHLITYHRKSLHQMVQLLAAFPRKFLPEDPTDMSAALLWDDGTRSFKTLPVTNQEGISVVLAMSIEKFRIQLMVDGKVKTSFLARDRSVNQAHTWLANQLTQLKFEGQRLSLEVPYDIEKYNDDQNLIVEEEPLQLMAMLYSESFSVLEGIRQRWPEAEPIRCWPHHFDLATLIPVEMDENGALAKSIGVGLSPGDESINEPYLYVNTWPDIEYEILNKHSLSTGSWNEKGWSGATLSYGQMLGGTKMDEFIGQSMDVILRILE